MQFFRDTNIDFMRHRRFWISVSAILFVGLAAFVFTGPGLNLGIDFAGGTQLTVKFTQPPQIDELRQHLEAEGLDDALIQRFGDPGDNSIIIKTPLEDGVDADAATDGSPADGSSAEKADEGNRS